MGRGAGRGAALNDALAATLAQVAAAMAAARAPWWVIGSAAVVLHGGNTDARDVDVLVAPGDVDAIVSATGAGEGGADGRALFHSARLLHWEAPPVSVEFMAGLRVARDDGWTAVEPRTRQRVDGGGMPLFVPSRDELRAILTLFGRPKDLRRATLLTPWRAPIRSAVERAGPRPDVRLRPRQAGRGCV